MKEKIIKLTIRKLRRRPDVEIFIVKKSGCRKLSWETKHTDDLSRYALELYESTSEAEDYE